jgi:hypothetical protein
MPIVMNPYRHRMEILTLILKLIWQERQSSHQI